MASKPRRWRDMFMGRDRVMYLSYIGPSLLDLTMGGSGYDFDRDFLYTKLTAVLYGW